ncbi:hypothetical protein [Oceanimonas sp. MB9]|uniref:hypothetical protein n=1 Tax=Oceanimonas sp. MB9 TaxID=2588453 RepID=UPI0013F5D5A0|nr:hypothetical protein [Oceanimonas sp. MB9]
MSKAYNQMHEKLVKNKQDFAGMIAYSIYKAEKRDAIRRGRNVEEFTKLKLQPNEVNKYKKEAEELVNIFLQTAADEEINKVKEQLIKEVGKITVKGLPSDPLYKKFKSWHNNGAAGVVGNFWTGAIVAIFVWLFADPATWEKAQESAKQAVTNIVAHPTVQSDANKATQPDT